MKKKKKFIKLIVGSATIYIWAYRQAVQEVANEANIEVTIEAAVSLTTTQTPISAPHTNEEEASLPSSAPTISAPISGREVAIINGVGRATTPLVALAAAVAAATSLCLL